MKKLLFALLIPLFASCTTSSDYMKVETLQNVVQSKRDKGDLFAVSNIWAIKPLDFGRCVVEYQNEKVGVIMGRMTVPVQNDMQPKTIVRALTYPKEFMFSFMIEVKDKKARLSFYDVSQRSETQESAGLTAEIEPVYKDFIAGLVKKYSEFTENYNNDW